MFSKIENYNYNIKKLQNLSNIFQTKLYFLKVKSTLNNVYVTITNNFGRIIFVGSGGFSKVSSNKRNTNYTLELLLNVLGKKLLSLNIKSLMLTLDSLSLRKKRVFIKVLQKLQIKILGIQLNSNKAFNGVHLCKRRRI